MKSIFAAAALFLAGVAAQDFQINTPSNVIECEPTLLSWHGGTPPYFLSILPGSSPNGNAIESFPSINATSLTWQTNIQSGTSIGFTLRDSNGNVAQSAAVTVNSGSSDSCLTSTSFTTGPTGTSSSSTASTTTIATTTSVTTTSATTGSVTTTTTTSASTPATTSSSTSPLSTSTPTSSSSGASANSAQLGVAAMACVAVAALFL